MFVTLRILVLALVSITCLLEHACADEIILTDKKYEGLSIFELENNAFQILPGQDKVTAGELWAYFNSQGIHSMTKLTLSMDIDPAKDNEDLDFDMVELSIKDPFSTLEFFHLDGIGENSLIVPSYEASPFRAEAQMEIDLGFDFMERFDENSQEMVVLNFKMKNGASKAQPDFFLSGEDKFTMPSAWTLAIFTGFWIVVFLILFRATKPRRHGTTNTGEKSDDSDPPNGSSSLPERFINKNRSGYGNVKTVS